MRCSASSTMPGAPAWRESATRAHAGLDILLIGDMTIDLPDCAASAAGPCIRRWPLLEIAPTASSRFPAAAAAASRAAHPARASPAAAVA
jgi:hypothetical protein